MLRHKKKPAIVTLLLALTVSMAVGCASNNETNQTGKKTDNSATQTEKPKEVAKIQYFTYSTGAKDVIQPLVDKFNEQHKGEIEVEVLWRSGDWQTPLKTSIAADQAPDIMHGVPNLNEAIVNEWIEPWDAYMSDAFKERLKGNEQIVSVNGKQQTYGFVTTAKTYRLAYNKDLFEKAGITSPPKTWDEFREISKKITETGEGDYYGTAFPMKGGNMYWYYIGLLPLEGAVYNEYNYQTAKFDHSSMAPIIQNYRDMMKDGSVIPGSDTMDNDAIRAQFAAGKVGMILSVSWDANTINNQFKSTANWDVAPLPTLTGEQKAPQQLRGGGSYYLSSSSKHKEAAMKFVEYMCSDEYLGELMAKGVDVATIQSAVDYAKAQPQPHKQWANYAPTEDEVYISVDAPSRRVEGDELGAVIAKLLLKPDLDINKELADVTKRYNDAMVKNAETDLAKGEKSNVVIDSVGKFPIIKDFDPQNIDMSKTEFISLEEWKKSE